MHNDESSQILGPCIAMANSPLLKTMQGALVFIVTGRSEGRGRSEGHGKSEGCGRGDEHVLLNVVTIV